MELTRTELIIPAGNPELPDRHIDMVNLYQLESRKQEVATVNKMYAPELMRAFEQGYGLASRAMVGVRLEIDRAKEALNKRKAVVMLDIAPTVLREKGLTTKASPAGAVELREAVLSSDEIYLDLLDRFNRLEAAYELLKIKAKGFEMSFQSVRKVYDDLSKVNILLNGSANSNMEESFGELTGEING